MPGKSSKQEAQNINPFAYLSSKEIERGRTCIAAIRSFLSVIYNIEQNRRYKNYTDDKGNEITVKMQQDADDILFLKLAKEYLADNDRDYCGDLIEWRKKSLQAPRTMKVYLNCMKEFLEINRKLVDASEYKGVIRKFNEGETAPRDAPRYATIRSFLEHCDIRMKAITLLLSSSGMRIGEVLALKEDWIDYDRHMITLPAKITKTKMERYVFFSKEAAQALNQWMRGRSEYIKQMNEYSRNFKDVKKLAEDDGRIFPFDTLSINKAWNKACKKAGLDQKDTYGHMIFHPHGMRHFFSTQMRRAGMQESITETLIGHKMSTYIRYQSDELQEAYEKFSPCLAIMSSGDVQKKLEALTVKVEAQNGKQTALELENIELRKKLATLEQKQKDEEYAQSKISSIPPEKLKVILELLK
jgi:integrase